MNTTIATKHLPELEIGDLVEYEDWEGYSKQKMIKGEQDIIALSNATILKIYRRIY